MHCFSFKLPLHRDLHPTAHAAAAHPWKGKGEGRKRERKRDEGREGVNEGLKVEKGKLKGERGTIFYTMP